MNLTFEEFQKIMQHFEHQSDFADDFRDILAKYNKGDFIDPYCFADDEADNIIVRLLEAVFGDEEHWLSYYIYELNCGRDWTPGMIIDEEGRDICLSDVWHLWNLLYTRMVDGEL